MSSSALYRPQAPVLGAIGLLMLNMGIAVADELHDAVAQNDIEAVTRALEQGIDPNPPSNNGQDANWKKELL